MKSIIIDNLAVIGCKQNKDDTFLGSAIIWDTNTIITCKHVVKNAISSKKDIFIQLPNQNLIINDATFSLHPKYDFAVCKLNENITYKLNNHFNKEILFGLDIHSYGFTSEQITKHTQSQPVDAWSRCLKGHIVRITPFEYLGVANSPLSKTTCEISFHIPLGCSGGPVFTKEMELVGMTYGNNSAKFLLDAIEIENSINYESYRLIEYGLIHTIHDIKIFIHDLLT